MLSPQRPCLRGGHTRVGHEPGLEISADKSQHLWVPALRYARYQDIAVNPVEEFFQVHADNPLRPVSALRRTWRPLDERSAPGLDGENWGSELGVSTRWMNRSMTEGTPNIRTIEISMPRMISA